MLTRLYNVIVLMFRLNKTQYQSVFICFSNLIWLYFYVTWVLVNHDMLEPNQNSMQIIILCN